MSDGVTFNGTHSSSMYLTVTSTRRPLFPETRDTFVDIPHKGGSFMIPDKSSPDIVVGVDFLLEPPWNSTLFNEARRVGEWLKSDGRAPLVFDDDPSFIYEGIVVEAVELEQIIRYGKFSVNFRCLP